MEILHYSFRLLALSQGCFVLGYLLLYQRNSAGAILSATVLGMCAYLLSPVLYWQLNDHVLVSLTALVATAVPSALWLLGNRFYNDETKAPLLFWFASIIYLGLWTTEEFFVVSFGSEALEGFVFDLVVQAIKLCLVLHVIYMALAGRASDLNRERLKTRTPIALGAAISVAIVILVELWLQGPSPMLLEVIGSGLMFLLSLASVLYLFRVKSNLGFKNSNETAQSGSDTNIEIMKVKEAMETDRFFAGHGSTLNELADELSIPTHRLRSLINGQLGYQNFNQFLNFYRIKEASTRLHSQKELPILTIALDVGFRSMSSFNKAFKDTHGITPSSFRNRPNRQ